MPVGFLALNDLVLTGMVSLYNQTAVPFLIRYGHQPEETWLLISYIRGDILVLTGSQD